MRRSYPRRSVLHCRDDRGPAERSKHVFCGSYNGNNSHISAVYSRLGDNVPSAAEEQALLLQDQSFCVGVIDAISNEEKRRRSCLNMCAVHYGACHALGYGMSLCR